jgi:hypothetical protein
MAKGFGKPPGMPKMTSMPAMPKMAKQPALPKALSMAAAKAVPIARVTVIKPPAAPKAPKAPKAPAMFTSGPMKGLGKR